MQGHDPESARLGVKFGSMQLLKHQIPDQANFNTQLAELVRCATERFDQNSLPQHSSKWALKTKCLLTVS